MFALVWMGDEEEVIHCPGRERIGQGAGTRQRGDTSLSLPQLAPESKFGNVGTART